MPCHGWEPKPMKLGILASDTEQQVHFFLSFAAPAIHSFPLFLKLHLCTVNICMLRRSGISFCKLHYHNYEYFYMSDLEELCSFGFGVDMHMGTTNKNTIASGKTVFTGSTTWNFHIHPEYLHHHRSTYYNECPAYAIITIILMLTISSASRSSIDTYIRRGSFQMSIVQSQSTKSCSTSVLDSHINSSSAGSGPVPPPLSPSLGLGVQVSSTFTNTQHRSDTEVNVKFWVWVEMSWSLGIWLQVFLGLSDL